MVGADFSLRQAGATSDREKLSCDARDASWSVRTLRRNDRAVQRRRRPRQRHHWSNVLAAVPHYEMDGYNVLEK